jgi:predicted acetyltransferase
VLEGPSSASLSEQAALLDVWWQAPGILFPFLIRVERLPAGFAFVASGKYVEQGIDASMQEFFLTHAYRRRGIAERAALKVLGGFPGRWEIRILESNLRARAFWTRVAQRIAPDHEQVEAEVSAGQRGRILRLSVAPALHAAPRA